MSSHQRDVDDDDGPEKYERLEQLLHQIFALAGEIAEDEGKERARSAGHLPGDLQEEAAGDEEGDGSRCPSAAPSVQEPFSPGTLALSLDAIVEGDGGGEEPEGALLDSGSATTLASPRPPGTPDRRSGPSSTEGAEGEGCDAMARRPSPHATTATGRPTGHHHQWRAPPPSRATNTQAPASPQTIGYPGVPARPASTQGCCPTPDGHAPSRQATDPPALTLDAPPSPGAGRGDCPPPPPRWRVRIVPVPWSPASPGDPSSASPTLVRLEAVFPYRFLAGSGGSGSAASSPAWWGSEGSYMIISRPPVDVLPGGPRPRDPGQGLQDVRERSLREHVGGWDDYAAGTPEADD